MTLTLSEKLSRGVKHGLNSEKVVRRLLENRGFVVTQRKHSLHDMVLNGHFRVEIKSCLGNLNGQGGYERMWWRFSLSRKDREEVHVDGYIFRLENVPGIPGAIHLFKKAPIGRRRLAMSLRALITQYSEWARGFKNLTPESLGLTNQN